MKKIIALAAMVVSFSATTVMAQGGGGGQQLTPEQRVAAQKERYKPLGLTDVQLDSVLAINADMRTLQGNMRDLSDEQRQAKMKEVSDTRQKRLEKALPADVAKKVIDFMSQQQQRPGGGRGGK